jgi:hypothetical protein
MQSLSFCLALLQLLSNLLCPHCICRFPLTFSQLHKTIRQPFQFVGYIRLEAAPHLLIQAQCSQEEASCIRPLFLLKAKGCNIVEGASNISGIAHLFKEGEGMLVAETIPKRVPDRFLSRA